MVPARPDIRFTNTADHVKIAYWEIGAGQTLVLAQNRSLSHADLEWEVPSMAALYLEMAKYFRLVRFDPRGAGLSGEPPTEEGVTLAGLVRDLDAVTDAVADDDLSVVGAISLGPAAIELAAKRPERVTRLVLCDTGANLSELPLDAFVRATDALVDLGLVPSLGGLFRGTPNEDLPALEALMKGSLYERPRIQARDLVSFDVSKSLPNVVAPTLVVKSGDSLYTDMKQIRRLVGGIPEAELRIVPGTMAPWLADLDEMMEALVSFLTPGHHRPVGERSEGLMTVVFTDLVASTELLNSRGDLEARRAFRAIEETVSRLSSQHEGRVVKELGDGSLIIFRSTRQAITFSLDLQESMSTQPMAMRIGMAAGEPIQEGGDVHGAVVVQASRIADLAEAGEVVVSDGVRQLAVGKEFGFRPRGEIQLKGFEEAQRIWTVVRP